MTHLLVRQARGRGIAHHIHVPSMQLRHRGHGFMDIVKNIFGILKPIVTNKDLQSGVKEIVTSGINIGKNTKSIVDSLRNKKITKDEILNAIPQPVQTPVRNTVNEIDNVINRINKIRIDARSGSGVKRKKRGKGFAYA